MSPKEAEAYRRRVVAVARDNPDITIDALASRFLNASKTRIAEWLAAEGVKMHNPFGGLADYAKNRKHKGGTLRAVMKKYKRRAVP